MQFAGFFIVKFHRNVAGVFLLLPLEPSVWTSDLQAWPILESPELKPVQMVNNIVLCARFYYFFSF